jgi:hypothetical protein
MKHNKVYLAIFSTMLLFLWQLPAGMLAQDTNQAALVIRHDDQSVQTACVEFLEPEISGLELLQRSGFDLELDVQGLGAAVCSIGQTGCPADDCWCQCKGGSDCIYWSYWQKLSGQWQYSQGGASIYTVGDGDMQGWSWGPGAVNAAFAPPNLSFENICTSSKLEDATATPTPTSLVFAPADTPISETRQNLPASTITTTPSPTLTIPPTATTLPAVTALPTSTQMPTIIAGDVPVVGDNLRSTPANFDPIASTDNADGVPAVPSPELRAAATSLPSPTYSPSPEGTKVVQTTPDAEVALASDIGSIPTRQGDQDTNKRVEISSDPPPKISVVGEGAQIPDLRVLPLMPEEQVNDRQEKGSPSSLSSYIFFSLIILALAGWLIISTYRRRERFTISEE